MSMIGYDFFEIPSNPSVSSSVNFTNNISFTIDQPTDAYISGTKSYISLGLQIVMTREDNTQHPLEPIINTATANARITPLIISVPYITPNPCGALFQNVSCSVNNNELTNYQNPAQTNTLYRMLYESEAEQRTVNSTNAIIPMSQDDLGTTAYATTDMTGALEAQLGANAGTLAGKLSKRMIYALKNQYNFNKRTTNKLNFQVPCPLFYSNDLIYVGSNGNIKLTFNVDSSNWYKNLIQIAGSNTCTLANGQAYDITNLSGGFSKCTINVSVTDFKLYIARAFSLSIPRNITQTYHLKQYSTFSAPLSVGGTLNNFTFSFKDNRRITHIIVAFFNARGTTFKSSPTDFSSSFAINGNGEQQITNDGMTNLKKLTINFGGHIYPTSTYNLENSVANSNTNDLARAYIDMVMNTDSIRDRSGCLLDFSKWLCQPIYAFRTHQNIENVSNTCSIACEVSQNASATNIFVLGLYDEYLSLSYGNNGEWLSYAVNANKAV